MFRLVISDSGGSILFASVLHIYTCRYRRNSIAEFYHDMSAVFIILCSDRNLLLFTYTSSSELNILVAMFFYYNTVSCVRSEIGRPYWMSTGIKGLRHIFSVGFGILL